jgi:hypothetical protein
MKLQFQSFPRRPVVMDGICRDANIDVGAALIDCNLELAPALKARIQAQPVSGRIGKGPGANINDGEGLDARRQFAANALCIFEDRRPAIDEDMDGRRRSRANVGGLRINAQARYSCLARCWSYWSFGGDKTNDPAKVDGLHEQTYGLF